ncbi:hypothetical protein BCR42DRAFT_487817 [Absidia repens]|uniref:Uncharacterized protein n=1 Tax=Absidia repens TaxID=90262 RepID=A0A1X2ITY3_9FUNG|nr:hypothetical protein BCR42DRAFT_487817 [Absidia repens]
MYHSHSTLQPDNTLNQGMPSSNAYYSQSNVTPGIPSTTSDMRSKQTQQPDSHPIILNPPFSATGQAYEHEQHHQELCSQNASMCPVLSSAIDEDVSSHASSSLSGNRNGGSQDTYILRLQKQLEESNHLQTQYYYRIEQLMTLVDKQTLRISELQEQLVGIDANGVGVVNSPIGSHQRQQPHPSSTFHLMQQQQQYQSQQQQQSHHHH